VIVTMRTTKDAARVAELTGAAVLLDEQGEPSARVRTKDFKTHQRAIESISVLFSLERDDGKQLPSPWVCLGARFEVEWPTEPQLVAQIRSHFAGLRYAKNWALAKVRDELERRAEDPEYRPTPWTLQAVRKA